MTTDQYLERVSLARVGRVSAESELTQAIVRASAAGIPYRAIGAAADISHQRVAQIVQASREPSEVGK